MWRRLSGAARGLLDVLAAPACLHCGGLLPHDRAAHADRASRTFCESCYGFLFSPPAPTCPRCAGTVGPHAYVEEGCLSCRGEHFAFASAQRLGEYLGPLRQLVLRFKDRQHEGAAELVGELWARHASSALGSVGCDAIVPVPLHWWRRFRRGYNQSEALSRGLAKALRIPVETRWLKRTRYTAPQSSISATQRKENVRGAFAPRRMAVLAKRSILLVDDVMTTGATLHEAARALRKGGASAVHVAVLARAGLG